MKILVGFKFHFGIFYLDLRSFLLYAQKKKPLDREIHFRQAKLKNVRTMPGGKVPLIQA